MGNSVWDPMQRSMSMAIPVLMEKKRLEQEKQQKIAELNAMAMQMREQSEQLKMQFQDQAQQRQMELQQKEMELQRKQQDAKVKFAQEMMKESYGKGDAEGVRAFGQPLAQMGMPVPARQAQGPSMPGQMPPLEFFAAPQKENAPGSVDAALAQMYAKDPKKLMDLFNAKNQKSGTRIEVGPDGQLTFAQGPGIDGAHTLTKPQQNKVQEKAIASVEGLKRMEGIVRSFKPEYLQIPQKLGAEWTALKEKFNMGDVNENDKAFLEEYSTFKQNSLENINLYIKEITGAQMSEKEAERIRRAMPDPGDGVFGGDSPTQFKSKIVNTYKKTKAVLARTNYYLNQGIPQEKYQEMMKGGMVVSLDEMEKIIDQRFDELMNQPGANMQQVLAKIQQEFGL